MKKRTFYSDSDYSQLRQRLLAYICDPNYEPKKAAKILRDVKITEDQRPIAKDVLDDLVREGFLVQLKHKGLTRAEAVDLFSGTITFIKSGAAFVNSPDGKSSIFVPAAQTGTALPSDRVLVRISNKKNDRGESYQEGTVIRVAERNCRHIVGTLNKSKRVYHVTPMQTSMKQDVIVPGPAGADIGDRVLVKLSEWEDPSVPPEGDIAEILGAADNPQLDTLAVIKAYDLREEFPQEVLREAEQADFSEADYEGREDIRDLFIFTIDPNTARDYDDAISLIPQGKGKWELGVHIADVAHFVKPGSPLDVEALRRGNSVYFPDKVIPMLPVQLSNGMCSLNPNKDRLAFSVFMTINKNGRVEGTRFANTVIHSKLRLTYHQALCAINSGSGASFPEWKIESNIVELIKTADQIANSVRQQRFAKGALDINLPQSEINLGKDGRISSISPVESDPAHQLIEEFMILANEAVSRHLSENKLPQIFRIHEEPDPEKLADVEQMFHEAGIHPGNLNNQLHLTEVLSKIQTHPLAHVWYMKVLRSLKRAVYSTECIGHYGLAKQFYCHFTSPIRRYPDLIMHRLMKGWLTSAKPEYRKREIDQICLQCSQLETNAMEAEREVLEQKKVRYFMEQLESGDLKEFDAVVTEVRNFGMTVELPSAQSFGMIHVSHLTEDFFDYNRQNNEFKGRKTKVSYKIGSRLKVIIVRVDERKRYLDFAPAGLVKGISSRATKISGPRVNASGNAPGGGGGKRPSGGRGKGKGKGKGDFIRKKTAKGKRR